jgi:hypothetical protein
LTSRRISAVWVDGGGSCATTTSGGYAPERISETAPMMSPSCATRISAARWDSPSNDGASATWAPELTQTRTLRCRRAADPAVGSCPIT